MINKKGQGTIEYLVIIAIVIVIALVVVGLLLQVMDQGSAIPEQTAKIAWQSATPMSIVDWSVNGTTMQVVLKNNTYQALTLVDFNLGPKNTADANVLQPGATHTISITGLNTETGKAYAFTKDKILIKYDTPDIKGRTQSGAADIIGTAG